MRRGIFGTPIVPAFNAVAAKLIDVPLLGNVVCRNLVMISYVGRRSGKTFTTPVNYRRVGDEVVIRVGLPGAKNWWRKLPGRRRPDYAAAQRHRPNWACRRDPRRSGPGDRHGQAGRPVGAIPEVHCLHPGRQRPSSGRRQSRSPRVLQFPLPQRGIGADSRWRLPVR